jgi:hypothetical protein
MTINSALIVPRRNEFLNTIGMPPDRHPVPFPGGWTFRIAMPDQFLGDADAETALHPISNKVDQPRRRRRASRLPVGFFTIAEVAALVQRARSCLYAEAKSGRLRCHRWRNRLVVSEVDLLAWLRPLPLPLGSDSAAAGAAAGQFAGAPHE